MSIVKDFEDKPERTYVLDTAKKQLLIRHLAAALSLYSMMPHPKHVDECIESATAMVNEVLDGT